MLSWPSLARRSFAIDPRSLALFRITLGSLVLLDLATRSPWLADHYSDWGLLPRQALAEEAPSAHRFCLHALSGATSFEAVLFGAAGALSVAFIFGRGGVVVAVSLWALTVSLQNRNFMILNKGDQIFRLLLFWSIFALPPPRVRSATAGSDPDAATRSGGARGPVFSVGSAGLLLQAALVWLVSAFLKTGREWFPDGTAAYYALQMDHGVTAFGRWVGGMFLLSRALTYGTLALEWAAALLLFCPVHTTAVRCVAIVLLAGMHIGFGMALRLGLFPAISICSLIPFIPAAVWDRLGRPEANGPRQGPSRPRDAFAREAVAAAALLLVVWLNAAAVAPSLVPVPAAVDRIAQALRIDQDWAMFAPYPYKDGGWFVVTGRLADGREVDAYPPSLAPPSSEKPPRLSSTFPSARWLYYLTNLSHSENAAERPWFARYLCRRFDQAHLSDIPLRDIDITFFREWTLPGYRKSEATKEVLWRQSCDEPTPSR
jgi:hypothetical protein